MLSEKCETTRCFVKGVFTFFFKQSESGTCFPAAYIIYLVHITIKGFVIQFSKSVVLNYVISNPNTTPGRSFCRA